MKRLHLIVPIDLPLDVACAQMPALRRLIAAVRPDAMAEGDALQAACAALGIARQQDWPLAPLLAQADGLAAATGYWLCAAPVVHEVGMNGLLLRRPGLKLDQAQAEALAATLRPELAPLGAELHTPTPERWYLYLPQAPRLVTRPFDLAIDRPVPTRWLAGEDASIWLRVMNAVQITLHQHPINLECETGAVNGLWLWAGGVSPPLARPPDAIWGEAPLPQALAQACGLAMRPLPARFSAQAGRGLVCIDHFDPVVLERDCFGPLVTALRWGRLGGLTLTLTGAVGRSFRLSPRDLWFS